MTKQEFIAFAKDNAEKSGMIANLLESDVFPCDCDYGDCHGWQIVTPPSMYLSPNIIISKLSVDN